MDSFFIGHMAGATLHFDDRAALANRDHLGSSIARGHQSLFQSIHAVSALANAVFSRLVRYQGSYPQLVKVGTGL